MLIVADLQFSWTSAKAMPPVTPVSCGAPHLSFRPMLEKKKSKKTGDDFDHRETGAGIVLCF